MCTAPASPHRPSSVQWPAGRAARDEAPAIFAHTTTRGHGRCPSTRSRPSIMSIIAGMGLSEQLRDVLEPGHQRRRQVDAGDEHRARDARTSAHRRPSPRRSAPRGSPNAMLLSRRNSAPNPTRMPNTSMIASHGSRAKVELTTRNSLMKMPSGGRPGDGHDAEHQAPAEHRIGHGQPAHVGDLLRALDLGDVADGEEDRRLGQAECMVMCSSPAKLASGPPMPKAKVMMPMCSIEE